MMDECARCGHLDELYPCIHFDNGNDTEAALVCRDCTDTLHVDQYTRGLEEHSLLDDDS